MLLVLALACGAWSGYASIGAAQVRVRTRITAYVPPRPPFAGLHIAMPEDSVFQIFRRIAARRDTIYSDSVMLVESDSVRIFGQPAYLQVQLLHHRARTIVINWHPMGGGPYLALRDQMVSYMEQFFGRGVVFTNGTLTYHRWETEDGTSETSHSDKYFRVFVRLGKPRETK